ncbi:GntR family transcriptional regulator [Orrella sp. JC864]|uniref:GntR family transcriptional regulator n=1 Tax=Orrella sp. JC864 TaxID=3120298 RepID=UPI00300BA870
MTKGAAARLYQRAFDILASQIREGKLPAGDRVLESGVAAQFGISRAPARQALQALQAEGLLDKLPGRGYAVRALAPGRPPRHGASAASRAHEAGPDLRLQARPSWAPIYAEVESQIAARTSFAGWQVNEAMLARHYQVSRTVARDVIGRLQQQGLLRKDESSRWLAPALTPEHVGQLYELRGLIEPAVLRDAYGKLPPGLLDQMARHLQQAIAHPRTIDGPLLDSLEQELHVTLLSYCGKQTMMQALALPQSLLIAHRYLYNWMPRLFPTEPFLAEHLEIVQSLRAGRPAAAAQLLKRHLQGSSSRAIMRIEAFAGQFVPEELPYLRRL